MRQIGLPLLLCLLSTGCDDSSAKNGITPPDMQFSVQISDDPNTPLPIRVAAGKQKLSAELKEAGLGRVVADLERLMKVSIRIKAKRVSEEHLTPAESRLGGVPTLPPGIDWPRCNGVPMAFLAQLELRNVAAYDCDRCLPDSGMLYFFYEASRQPEGFTPEDRGNWMVVHFDGDLSGLHPTPPPPDLPRESRFHTCHIALSNEITLSPWESLEIEQMGLSKEERGMLIDVLDAIGGSKRPTHRLLGNPDQLQGEMRTRCQRASTGISLRDAEANEGPRRKALEGEAKQWQLLLQIDSDLNEMDSTWGDSGRVFYWIRKEDLRKRSFDRAWVIMDCY